MQTPETVTLFRPVGLKELSLIRESGYRESRPACPSSPSSTPSSTKATPRRYARDWNTRHSEDRRGFVTRFRVRAEFLSRYEVQTVGGSEHKEYWIPAAELPEFNRHLVGEIEVIAEFSAPAE